MSSAVQPLHRFAHEAMATTFEVAIAGQDATYAHQAAGAVFREIDRLEGLLSRFQPLSDIAQINRLRPGQSLRVSIEVFECLQLAAQVHAETGGAFDVTVGPLMDLMREAKGNWQRVSEAEIAAARARIGLERLVLNEQELTAGIRPAADGAPAVGVEVDLGAIGKGYALDQAAALLADWEIEDALLHGGTSSVLALGSGGAAAGCPEGQRGWALGVGGDWRKQAGFEAVLLSGAALSGSGTEVKGQHILDPRSGRPAAGHLAAWAVAPSAAASDALSTAFMVMTTAAVNVYCRAHPAVAAMVVEERRGLLRVLGDRVVATPAFAARALAEPAAELLATGGKFV